MCGCAFENSRLGNCLQENLDTSEDFAVLKLTGSYHGPKKYVIDWRSRSFLMFLFICASQAGFPAHFTNTEHTLAPGFALPAFCLGCASPCVFVSVLVTRFAALRSPQKVFTELPLQPQLSFM